MVRAVLKGDGRVVVCEGDGWSFVAGRSGSPFTLEEAENLCKDVEKLTKKLDKIFAEG